MELLRRRWNWIGHVLRRDENNIAKQALFWNPQGTRKRGRPFTTWKRARTKEISKIGLTWKQLKTSGGNRMDKNGKSNGNGWKKFQNRIEWNDFLGKSNGMENGRFFFESNRLWFPFGSIPTFLVFIHFILFDLKVKSEFCAPEFVLVASYFQKFCFVFFTYPRPFCGAPLLKVSALASLALVFSSFHTQDRLTRASLVSGPEPPLTRTLFKVLLSLT